MLTLWETIYIGVDTTCGNTMRCWHTTGTTKRCWQCTVHKCPCYERWDMVSILEQPLHCPVTLESATLSTHGGLLSTLCTQLLWCCGHTQQTGDGSYDARSKDVDMIEDTFISILYSTSKFTGSAFPQNFALHRHHRFTFWANLIFLPHLHNFIECSVKRLGSTW